ncbi:hypothetical protein BDA99DRAFT_603387 [Phascolomyces articulosus]|uniref:Uncharacterized protein n=1 Tax=Phascolomyces articulosus TaxID=60185 RepID=A0AAD5K4Y2_9FUNG|nr:hypothetical protein BDA99DRAFT_603387 [Phascolomyces articulosus]
MLNKFQASYLLVILVILISCMSMPALAKGRGGGGVVVVGGSSDGVASFDLDLQSMLLAVTGGALYLIFQ